MFPWPKGRGVLRPQLEAAASYLRRMSLSSLLDITSAQELRRCVPITFLDRGHHVVQSLPCKCQRAFPQALLTLSIEGRIIVERKHATARCSYQLAVVRVTSFAPLTTSRTHGCCLSVCCHLWAPRNARGRSNSADIPLLTTGERLSLLTRAGEHRTNLAIV